MEIVGIDQHWTWYWGWGQWGPEAAPNSLTRAGLNAEEYRQMRYTMTRWRDLGLILSLFVNWFFMFLIACVESGGKKHGVWFLLMVGLGLHPVSWWGGVTMGRKRVNKEILLPKDMAMESTCCQQTVKV